MSRRRSINPTTAISITLPRTVLGQIDDRLTRLQSRSAWIAEACHRRLSDDDTVHLTTRQLMAMLHARVEDETLKTVLLDRLTN